MEVTYKYASSEEEIKKWVEDNEGKPAIIDDPQVENDPKGLRIDFPGEKDESMLSSGRETTRDISWEEFFTLMKTHELGFMYSDDANINSTWRYKFVNKAGRSE